MLLENASVDVPTSDSTMRESGRWKAAYAIVGTLGGGGSFLVWYSLRSWLDQWGWVIDAISMALIGIVAGGAALERLARDVPRYERSDFPVIVGSNCGLAVMVAIWMRLSREATTWVGAFCWALIGVIDGMLLVRMHYYHEVERPARLAASESQENAGRRRRR
jgi:hypothetical protein